jgi:homospermidine synthase
MNSPLDRLAFSGRILFLGCGSVAQCSLPLLVRHLDIRPDQITILDYVDNRARVADLLELGVKYVEDRVTADNLSVKLAEFASSGDIIIDLAWNIDCGIILQWCHDHGVRYLNTSVEVWDPYLDADSMDPRDRSLYVRHMDVRRRVATWDTPGPTAILEHGANPGLVSHFVKQGLTSIATRLLAERPADLIGAHGTDLVAVESALTAEKFPELAMALGVKVIHVAERDTQISDRPKEVDEFVNTWSVEGLYEEGLAPAELGWGTHERRMPADAYVHQSGPSNQIALARMGLDTMVRSWTPGGEIIGWVVRHGEAFTICDHLTVWDGDRAVYRPTVHYAYCMSDAAIASVHELKARHLVMQSRQRIMNDEIVSGSDFMGVLLMGHPYTAWWTGSCLDIDTARSLVPHQSATTVQVGASVLAATRWMIRHPDAGVCVPDDLGWQEVLNDALPYLGQFFDEAVDWTPLANRAEASLFGRYAQPRYQLATDADETWQFTTFLVN